MSAPPPPATPVLPERRAICVIATDSVGPARPVTAAFDDPTDARRSRLAASRVPPVRLDCENRPAPGLAERWSRDSSGRFWTLELAPTPLSPTDTTPRWTAGALAATWSADPEAARALVVAGVTSVAPLDDRRLVVGFAAAQPEVPTVFGDRALAVGRGDVPSLTESEPSTGDLRDALDAGTDVVVTGDPDLLDYAGRRAGFISAALPWSRTYYLSLPAGSPTLGDAIPSDTGAFRAALARDAVRIDARPVNERLSADATARCRRPPRPAQRPPFDVIAYPGSDRTARELAERLVALAGPLRLTARALQPDSLMAALDRGAARAFVLPGAPLSAGPCADSASYPPDASVVPLVETRRHAIVRRGAPALAVEWDGAVRAAESGDTTGSAP
jgi:hypothetical protein